MPTAQDVGFLDGTSFQGDGGVVSPLSSPADEVTDGLSFQKDGVAVDPATEVVFQGGPTFADKGTGVGGPNFPSYAPSLVGSGNEDLPPDWYRLEGTDSVTLSQVVWYGHSTTTAPPTQNPVINVSSTRVVSRLPQTDGTS